MKTDLFFHYLSQKVQLENNRLTIHNSPNEFLQKLYELIENSIDDSFLNVGFLAKHMAMSKSTLNRRLSSLTGLSANELIRQYRLKKAPTFLVSGKKVSETAYLTGFETPSYFTQCFKEFYKVTPKEYSRAILVSEAQ